MKFLFAIATTFLAVTTLPEIAFVQDVALPGSSPQPKLVDRCHKKTMLISRDHGAFMEGIKEWMSTCVTSRTINPETGQPYERELELVNKARPDIQAIYEYAKRHPLFSDGVRMEVNAVYDWGRTLNGGWWVRGVHFWVVGQELPPPPPEPPDPKPWAPVFEPNKASLYPVDIQIGGTLLDSVKNAAYQEAKKEASLLKNPVSTPSGKDLAEAFTDVATGGGLPFLDLGKMAIGSLLQAVINGDAGNVARVRRLAYYYFMAGFVQVISIGVPAEPKTDFGKKYYTLGQNEAHKLDPQQRYQVQMALLYYISKNPNSGWRIPTPENWKFPDDYARNWSPERLADALYNQLYKPKYSVD